MASRGTLRSASTANATATPVSTRTRNLFLAESSMILSITASVPVRGGRSFLLRGGLGRPDLRLGVHEEAARGDDAVALLEAAPDLVRLRQAQSDRDLPRLESALAALEEDDAPRAGLDDGGRRHREPLPEIGVEEDVGVHVLLQHPGRV